VRITEVLYEIGKGTTRNVALLPVLAATDNFDLFSGAVVKVVRQVYGAVQNAEVRIIEMRLQPVCFDEILRVLGYERYSCKKFHRRDYSEKLGIVK
jgi:hypothetical protein